MSLKVHVAPVVIQVLIAVHCQPRRAWTFDETAPSYAAALSRLIGAGIVSASAGIVNASVDDTYSLTDRGRVWLESILSTPYPVAKWVDPRFGVV